MTQVLQLVACWCWHADCKCLQDALTSADMNCCWQMHATDQANMKQQRSAAASCAICAMRICGIHCITPPALLVCSCYQQGPYQESCALVESLSHCNLLYWQIMRAHTHMMGNMSMQRTPLCMQHSTSLTACCLRSKHGS